MTLVCMYCKREMISVSSILLRDPWLVFTLAYVTYQDIHSIQAFHEQIVIAVKAPAETRLDVPAPREVGIPAFLRGVFKEGGRCSCRRYNDLVTLTRVSCLPDTARGTLCILTVFRVRADELVTIVILLKVRSLKHRKIDFLMITQ